MLNVYQHSYLRLASKLQREKPDHGEEQVEAPQALEAVSLTQDVGVFSIAPANAEGVDNMVSCWKVLFFRT